MGDTIKRAVYEGMEVTLVGGPQNGEMIRVDVFTIGVTHEATGAYYERRKDEVWLYDYKPGGAP